MARLPILKKSYQIICNEGVHGAIRGRSGRRLGSVQVAEEEREHDASSRKPDDNARKYYSQDDAAFQVRGCKDDDNPCN